MNNLKNLLIPVITIIILILIVFLISNEPLKTLYYFFIGPFRNIHSFGNLLNACIPLIIGALGISIAVKAGHLNLGGEGQIYLGAFVTTACALYFSDLGVLGAFFSIILGCLASGLMAGVSGVCKAFWKTNELITSFLLSLAVIYIVNYLVQGPFLDPDTSLIATRKIPENFRLPFILKPSNLNAGIYIALIFVIIVQIFLSKTKLGYEFRISGDNELFARYGGVNIKLNTVISLSISGVFYGLAGAVMILGTYHSVIKEFSLGLGWNALAVALIAGFNPIGIIPASIFFAWIGTGARIAMQNTGLTVEVALIVQGIIFLLSTCKYLIQRKIYD